MSRTDSASETRSKNHSPASPPAPFGASLAASLAAFRLELRAARRRLAARPSVTLALVASLAAALALTSLGTRVGDALLLRPLPAVDAPGDLVVLRRASDADDARANASVSWLDLVDLRTWLGSAAGSGTEGSLSHVTAFYATTLGLSSELASELGTRRIEAVVHADGYGATLGVTPWLGRWPRDTLAADGSERGAALEAALGHRLWLDLGRPDPGSAVRLQGRRVEIVGVLPAGFAGTDRIHRPDVWIPISTFESLATGVDGQWAAQRGARTWLTLLARVDARDDTAAALEGRLATAAEELATRRPDAWQDRRIEAMPLAAVAFGGAARRADLLGHLRLLGLALAATLLVAFGNAVGVVAVRAADRRTDLAVRRALGADAGHLRRAGSAEGLLLGVGALLLAPGVAALLVPFLGRLRLPAGAQVDLAFDGPLLAVLAVVGVAGVAVLTWVPRIAALAVDPSAGLEGADPRAAGVRAATGVRTGQLFLAAQVALTFVALGAAFQMARTVHAYRQVDVGVARHVAADTLALRLDVGAAGHEGGDALRTFARIDETLRRADGVWGASLASALPILRSGPAVHLTIDAEGALEPPAGQHHAARHALVGPRFFSLVGRRIVEGREFGPGDDASAPLALVVERGLARSLWGERSALGRQIRLVATEEPYTVVGVVEDGRYGSLGGDPEPTLYLAHAQSERSLVAGSLAGQATVLVRLAPGAGSATMSATSSAAASAAWVRAAVAEVDPAVPVLSVQTLESLVDEHFALERQIGAILGVFAGALLLFCLVGVYGGLSQILARERTGLAVRAALGAGAARLLGRLARPVGQSLLLGVLVGVWLAPRAGALLSGLLFGVAPGSGESWVAAAAVLALAVLLAGLGPLRRTLAIEPAALLRRE